MRVSQKYNAFLRDVSIGFSESASYMFVFTCAFIAASPSHSTLLLVSCIAGVCLAIIYGIIGYVTAKNIIYSQEKNARILSDENAMQEEIEKKKTFLRNINMQPEIIALSENEVRQESEEDARLDSVSTTKMEVNTITIRLALASIAASLIVLTPYFFTKDIQCGLIISGCISLFFIALALYIKSLLTGVSVWLGAFSNTLLTALAGICIYYLIRWISI